MPFLKFLFRFRDFFLDRISLPYYDLNEEVIQMDIGELITAYRKEAGMTIDELVDSSGVSRGTITKIISGVTKAPTLDNVKAIARALGRPLADFDDDASHLPEFSFSEREHIKKYRALDIYGKRTVDGVLKSEYDRVIQANPEQKPTETKRVWLAARSTDNAPSGWVDMPTEEVEKIFNAPDADVDF